jgi:protein-tyrosine phosphatase
VRVVSWRCGRVVVGPRISFGMVSVGRVLFVCTANVCRSPMAVAIFDALAAERGLPFRAESAGTRALVGDPITGKASGALEAVGVEAGDHRARQVTAEMAREADLVLAMSPSHVEYLSGLGEFRNVYTLREWAEGRPDTEGIADPHGHTMLAHHATVRQLFGYVKRVLERLERDGEATERT